MFRRAVRFTWLPLVLVGGLLAALGCADEGDRPAPKRKTKTPPTAASPDQGKGKVNVGQNVFLEILPTSRRVLISAEVCLREGPLELLLTRKGTKEHEAVLRADVDARKVHDALLLAGAKAGGTVRFDPRYRPARGTPIKVSLVYKKDGTLVNGSARSWVRNARTKRELPSDWVFAGSELVEGADPLNPNGPKRYLANDGDLICVANFETALLDLPIESSKSDDDRGYEAWTERIPEPGTPVVVVLEPQVRAKGKK
jgi:hypothetical protein